MILPKPTSVQRTLLTCLLIGVGLTFAGCTGDVDSRVQQLQQQLDAANSKVQSLQQQLSSANAQLQSVTSERDAYAAKFGRSTILYDTGLLGAETRAWMIPADLEPTVIGNKRGTFTHYDPKTQTETVHFQPKPQQ